MNPLQEKSLRVLEMDKALAMLANQAVSARAKENAAALRPAEFLWEAQRRQAETSAARHLIGLRGSPVFSGIREVGGALTRADMGGVLNTRELLDTASLLSAARAVKSYGQGDMKTVLDPLFAELKANKYLEERITTCILGEEEIADAASSELASIRRHMRLAHSKARDALQKIISSSAHAKALQEPIITMRGDRFVVPVRAEHRSEIPGLTHDISSSGATYFIEPMQVVQLGNELREWTVKEQKEIERILAELSAEVAAHAADIGRDFELLCALDLIFAKGKLSYEWDAAEPALAEDGVIELKNARHPLLGVKKAVPITVRLGGSFDTLVITGPNTGGKTVTLKTLGLFCLLAACGVHIPADPGSRVSLFSMVLSDIGDEQSIEQSLSTFSSHMTNIVAMLEHLSPSTLVLFDELGAGTDPVEGAALAVAIIQHVRKFGTKIAATTHYSELKVFALTTKGVENASCEFDVETLRPTYRLLIGVPGKSNAFAISQRLGLPVEIIAAARGGVGVENKRFEDVISRLEAQRQALESEKTTVEVLRRETEQHNKAASDARSQWEKERSKATERARAEARLIIEQARQTVDTVMEELDELRRHQAQRASIQEQNDARVEVRRLLNEAERQTGSASEEMAAPAPKPSRPVAAGDTVRLLKTGTRASVLLAQEDTLVLQAGIMKVTVARDEVVLDEAPAPDKPRASASTGAPRVSAVKPEADLRGQMVEEALLSMESFLDEAILGGLHIVTVIHGKGTGALRTAVHAALRKHPQVKSFRLGRYGEGEHGVTVVELR